MLLRGGNFPTAYIYPAELRDTCDLLRRRCTIVRRRGATITHVQMSNHQQNLPAFFRLQSIPGVGRILAMRMLYEIHDIKRFPAVGIEKKHNKARANTLLVIKLGRAVYWMWKRKAAFNPNVFAKD